MARTRTSSASFATARCDGGGVASVVLDAKLNRRRPPPVEKVKPGDEPVEDPVSQGRLLSRQGQQRPDHGPLFGRRGDPRDEKQNRRRKGNKLEGVFLTSWAFYIPFRGNISTDPSRLGKFAESTGIAIP